MRVLIVTFWVACLLMSTAGLAQDSEAIAPASQGQVDPQYGSRRNQRNPDDAKVERDMARQRAKERQQKLKDDTDRLLKLATELKEYVDKTNEHILSLDVLKKTDEIDKLARAIRDKMKAGSYDGVVQ